MHEKAKKVSIMVLLFLKEKAFPSKSKILEIAKYRIQVTISIKSHVRHQGKKHNSPIKCLMSEYNSRCLEAQVYALPNISQNLIVGNIFTDKTSHCKNHRQLSNSHAKY